MTAAGCRMSAFSTCWWPRSSANSPRRSAEGWKWIDVAPDFAYGHTYGLRQLRGDQPPLTDEEQATRDALQAEMHGLEETYAEADELPDEVDQRLGEIETALAAFDDRPQLFDPEEVARAGAFVRDRTSTRLNS